MPARTIESRPLGAMGRIGVVAAMHAAFLFVIARSLVHTGAPDAEPLIGTVINEPTPIIDVPIEPTVTIVPQEQITVPRPIEPYFDASDPTPAIQAAIAAPDESVSAGSATVQPAIVPVREDERRPLTAPAYPPGSIRNNEEGTTQLNVFVLPNGRVGEVQVIRSSGFERLDRAAIEEARRRWRFVPATQDGAAISQWYRVPVTFRLEDAARR